MDGLTQAERTMLKFALELAEEHMLWRSDEFEDEEFEALARLQARVEDMPGNTRCGMCNRIKRFGHMHGCPDRMV